MQIWNAGIPWNVYVSSGLSVAECRRGRQKEKKKKEKSGCAYIPWYTSANPGSAKLTSQCCDAINSGIHSSWCCNQGDPFYTDKSRFADVASAWMNPILANENAVIKDFLVIRKLVDDTVKDYLHWLGHYLRVLIWVTSESMDSVRLEVVSFFYVKPECSDMDYYEGWRRQLRRTSCRTSHLETKPYWNWWRASKIRCPK